MIPIPIRIPILIPYKPTSRRLSNKQAGHIWQQSSQFGWFIIYEEEKI